MKTKGTALNNLPLQHVSRLIKGSKTEVEVKATKQIAALLHKTKDTDLKKKGGKKCKMHVISYRWLKPRHKTCLGHCVTTRFTTTSTFDGRYTENQQSRTGVSAGTIPPVASFDPVT